ncbi:nicotinamide riboside transporter PnuC [Corallincola platygyrae]|uniref:Nicotinamide riboside transporter PnuC n=1 Tax=Corallincola platygyrae TaxID=1193278 RepID=A0ABW4XKX0_9GAMM
MNEQSLFSDIQIQFHALVGWELVAVLLAIAYLVLAMKRSLWCWPAAFFSTLIYTMLFWHVALLMESALNVYYMAMAGYGLWMWQRDKADDGEVHVTRWPIHHHLIAVFLLSLVAVGTGWLMDNYSSADFAYLDAATTTFAVFTTYLVAAKVLENWLYWIVIDAVSIYLYSEKGLYLTALLFVFYVVLAVMGYNKWKQAELEYAATH